MNKIFADRSEAGTLLADQLELLPSRDRKNSILLALPRGGVPIAHKISQALGVQFDLLIVRKIGHPLHPEYGIGAIAEDGFYWVDSNAVATSKVTTPQLNLVIDQEKKEIERRVKTYRQGRPLSSLRGKTVILIDDGLATGVTARVAARFAKDRGAKKVILAVPVCSKSTARQLRSEIEIICLNESSSFLSVADFYRNFDQVSDEEVLAFFPKNQN